MTESRPEAALPVPPEAVAIHLAALRLTVAALQFVQDSVGADPGARPALRPN